VGFLTLYWWELAAYLFGYSSFIIVGLWLLTTLKEKPMPIGVPLSKQISSTSTSESIPEVRQRGERTVWISTLTLLIGIGLGISWSNWRFLANRYTYADVLIVARHDARNFTLQPARMQPFEARTCSDTDWQRLEKMRILTYQQSSNCKEVGARGAVDFYSEHGKRILYPQEMTDARF
jgi:hypothetical protein